MALPRLRQQNGIDEKPIHPNHMIYAKVTPRFNLLTFVQVQMEMLVREMMDAERGLPIKTVKSFMSRVPSVFTGVDLIAWFMNNAQVQDLSELVV